MLLEHPVKGALFGQPAGIGISRGQDYFRISTDKSSIP